MKTVYLELTKRARTKEVTGLLHISDRLLRQPNCRVWKQPEELFSPCSIEQNNN